MGVQVAVKVREIPPLCADPGIVVPDGRSSAARTREASSEPGRTARGGGSAIAAWGRAPCGSGEDGSGTIGPRPGGSLVAHLLVVRLGLGLLGLGDAAAALVDHGEGGVAERVVRLQLDDPLRVVDRLVGLGEVGVELGEHAVADREVGVGRDGLLQLGDGPFLVPLVAEVDAWSYSSFGVGIGSSSIEFYANKIALL